jgi:putative ATP-dependent endonuclease of OLD family
MSPLDVVAIQSGRPPRQLDHSAQIGAVDSTARHWVQSLIEPVTARAVILVEGPSDRILIERIAELQEIDLNRLSVSVFELDGSGLFARAYSLLGPEGFDIPLFGLLDEDAKEDWADTLGLTVSKLEADERFQICNEDLEGEYVRSLGSKRVLEILESFPFFDEKSIEKSCGKAVTKLTDEDVATFCRHKKRKVQAALALAEGMTAPEAKSIAPAFSLVQTSSQT